MKKIFTSRFALLFGFILTYLFFSFLVRSVLFFISFHNLDISILSMLRIFGTGFLFDLSIAIAFSILYAIYLLLIPSKLIGSKLDKVLSYSVITLILFICLFGFAAEFPFWEEFNARFNFIAVDYLIYTYEVIENINQSYPIYLILLFLILIILGLFFLYKKTDLIQHTFNHRAKFKTRLTYFTPILILGIMLNSTLKNQNAEWSTNLYNNELSKNGTFSFFSALRSNELDYNTFYPKLPEKEAYTIIKKELLQKDQQFTNTEFDNVLRNVEGADSTKPNIILVTIESLSAEFLGIFGNKDHLTPFLDSLSENSIFFTNLYATGTRTVRGMEALTLCVPPTPGNSIVRRPNNDNLFSIATILHKKGYLMNFIYGGDGYFDNMNTFFGGQGFDIIDRNRGNPLSDNIKTKRYQINDEEVTFENAWGICDEDIYKQSLKYADLQAARNQTFFHFIMTTSNHKPFTFPDGKIKRSQGSREAAVEYTDFALSNFIKSARSKPWFANTIFVIVADHCASSAGKWEINIEKHHIPALIYNLNNQYRKINKLVSQIDLIPSLFDFLNWNYQTELYGLAVDRMDSTNERALIGNYRTLGMLKNEIFTEINDRKKVKQYLWNAQTKTMTPLNSPLVDSLEQLTISYFQTASQRFKNGKMKHIVK